MDNAMGVNRERDVRKRVAELWCEALNVAAVSDTDDFFALGGHSLVALNVIASVEEEYGIELDGMRDIWEHPTFAEFTSLVVTRISARATPSDAA
ncbi:phosphopantetheine-binding protein [Streptomyces sp. 7-21]|jgi:phthiocerol/phenolphthiocerol synthesis type-I polyketide synthase E|uniref:phosphopantetheine-binding protein n=1 Tax=Streptomyces sp. 7-21 TaxID=2802283 RepID=UPI00191E28BA|nr:phosphopantetheine-binding protein [Streptomyces sp. 7-21]MBL1069002.1 hypothetical protein [Streptomyces sp. 7-21]